MFCLFWNTQWVDVLGTSVFLVDFRDNHLGSAAPAQYSHWPWGPRATRLCRSFWRSLVETRRIRTWRQRGGWGTVSPTRPLRPAARCLPGPAAPDWSATGAPTRICNTTDIVTKNATDISHQPRDSRRTSTLISRDDRLMSTLSLRDDS